MNKSINIFHPQLKNGYIDFLWLLFLVDVICPLMQEHFI